MSKTNGRGRYALAIMWQEFDGYSEVKNLREPYKSVLLELVEARSSYGIRLQGKDREEYQRSVDEILDRYLLTDTKEGRLLIIQAYSLVRRWREDQGDNEDLWH